jgi:hypothetical protein
MNAKKRRAPRAAKRKENPQFPYARCSIGALARLLNAACGQSAIHRGILAEFHRRSALASKTKPVAPPDEQPLLFTGTEWSETIHGRKHASETDHLTSKL